MSSLRLQNMTWLEAESVLTEDATVVIPIGRFVVALVDQMVRDIEDLRTAPYSLSANLEAFSSSRETGREPRHPVIAGTYSPDLSHRLPREH